MTRPETEEWLPVVGWEDLYLVSSWARVRSLPRITRDGKRLYGQILRPGLSGNGYLSVNLCRNGQKTGRTVHSIVCEAFHGPCPEGMRQIRHLDGVKIHNEAWNLEWGTGTDDNFDRIKHGTHQYANREKCSEGHDLSGDNVRIRLAADGTFKQRICLQCRRDRTARITAEKPLIPVVCGYCGTPFEKPQTVGKARRKYCSPECQTAMRNAQSLAAWRRGRTSTT